MQQSTVKPPARRDLKRRAGHAECSASQTWRVARARAIIDFQMPDDDSTLPVIDLSNFGERRAEIAEQLLTAFRDIGEFAAVEQD